MKKGIEERVINASLPLVLMSSVLEGTVLTTDRMGLTFPSLQSEANFWYNYVCDQTPPDCWLQPGNTARDKSACAQCEADCSESKDGLRDIPGKKKE